MIPRVRPFYDLPILRQWIRFTIDRTAEFETEFSKLTGFKYAILFPYGRSALYSLLKAMEIRDKDIFFPAYTCAVFPHAAVKSGNKARFFDIEPRRYSWDLDELTARIGGNTAGVVATEMFGYPLRVNDVVRLRSKLPEKSLVVHDAALAIGTVLAGESIAKQCDCSIFSFSLSKEISLIEGGALCTDREDIYEKVKAFRDRDFRKRNLVRCLKKNLFFLSTVLLHPTLYGCIFKLKQLMNLERLLVDLPLNEAELPDDALTLVAPLQSRIGLHQLDNISLILSRRRRIYDQYFNALSELPGIECPEFLEKSTPSHFNIYVDNREKLQVYLLKKGVETGTLFSYVNPELGPYRDGRGEFSGAKFLARSIINLPMYPSLSESHVSKIITALRHYKGFEKKQ